MDGWEFTSGQTTTVEVLIPPKPLRVLDSVFNYSEYLPTPILVLSQIFLFVWPNPNQCGVNSYLDFQHDVATSY